jgi:trehalose/maltose hydrolase-like predicted phosphorylase
VHLQPAEPGFKLNAPMLFRDVLRLNPRLPHDVERLDMRIRYRDHSLDLRLTRDALTVRERETCAAPIKLAFKDDVYGFAGGTRVFKLGS